MKSYFIIFLSLFLCYKASGQFDSLAFIVAPYLQFATKSEMTILWETNMLSTGYVRYGRARLNATAQIWDSIVQVEAEARLHEVKLDRLDTGEKYIYQVISKSTNTRDTIYSEISTFKTAVSNDNAIYFGFIGDTQFNSKTPWAWRTIAHKVWEERPDFVVHAGDIVDIGTKKSDWTDHFFKDGRVLLSRYPVFTVLGNHEQDATYYYEYMANPAPEYYYTFEYGNAQFFMIDTNRDVQEGSEQYNWLEWELSRSKAIWKFVVHHHPPYSSEENDHGDTYIGASTYGTHARNLVPLYEAYGVDFCLFGHTHVYERTWPILENRINRANGVIYINSGGAGGGLEDFDPVRSWFTKELQTGHHYTTFAIYENELQFRAIDHEGKMFDFFTLIKEEANRRSAMMRPPVPRINPEHLVFTDSVRVTFEAIDSTYRIFYTIDGSEPDTQAYLAEGDLILKSTCTIKARCYLENQIPGRVNEVTVVKMDPLPASTIQRTKLSQGLAYRYYEGEWSQLPAFENLEPDKTGYLASVNLSETDHGENHFAVQLDGYFNAKETGRYTFYTYSDDGSALYIDGRKIVDSDGNHSARYASGTVILEEGLHRLNIQYFEETGSNILEAGIMLNGKPIPFSPFSLFH